MNLLDTIARAKAPYFAVPRPGGTPFVMRRALVKAALQGMKVTRAEFDDNCLLVEGHAPNNPACHFRTKFLPIKITTDYMRREIVREIHRWAEKERKARLNKLTAKQKRLASLRAKIFNAAPRNPMLGFHGCFDYGYGSRCTYGDNEILEWYQQKLQRRKFRSREELKAEHNRRWEANYQHAEPVDPPPMFRIEKPYGLEPPTPIDWREHQRSIRAWLWETETERAMLRLLREQESGRKGE